MDLKVAYFADDFLLTGDLRPLFLMREVFIFAYLGFEFVVCLDFAVLVIVVSVEMQICIKLN